MKTLHDIILDKTYAIYQEQGQSGVFNWVNQNMPNADWRYCEPCEIESPTSRGICLTCWTDTRNKLDND